MAKAQLPLVNEATIRRVLVELMRLAYSRRLVDTLGGNASARLSNEEILITPSGIPKFLLRPQNMVKMRLDGTVLSGGRPSSEWRMHVGIYQRRDDVRYVLHTHPPNVIALSMAGYKIETTIAEAEYIGEIAEVPYYKPGSVELAEAVMRVAARKNVGAIILKNHGLVTLGSTAFEALARAEIVEKLAYITLMSKLLE